MTVTFPPKRFNDQTYAKHSRRPILIAVVTMHLSFVALLLTMKVVQAPKPLEALTVTLYDLSQTMQPKLRPTEATPKPILKQASILTTPAPDIVAVLVPVIVPAIVPVTSPSTQVSVSPAPTRVAQILPDSPPTFDADYLNNPAPTYPSVAKKRLEQGVTILRVRVESDGLPAEVLVHRSSGFEALDEAALKSVRRWKFVPARQGEMLVSAWVLVPVAFSLRT